MTDNATTFAMLGLSGGELVLILLTLVAVPVTIVAIVLLVLWLVRRNHKQPPAPTSFAPPPATATKRFCPQCGKEMSPDAPQGLCPSCLMQVALGTQSGESPKHDGTRPPPPAPSELASRFPQLEILELLGHGGMGAVYKARQKNLDRLVALKVLPAQSASDPGFTERFNREARALAKLSHPHIVGVYEYGQAEGVPYFIMEYVDGVNLRQMQQAGKLAPREALKIIPQICEALQFAHDEGIVHRDIKPENVLLDKKGRAKIADFGLARILGREPSSFRLTGARDIMGTPHYMAPEQIEKPQTVDHRADIYSLGVVFYEMLTGELPLGRFAPPSERVQLDVRLDEVVLKTLEKEPGRRYQHVGEVKTRLETIANQPATAATAPVAPHWARGVDYKSKRTLFGLPLIHVSTGVDPITGRTKIARGFIAIGGVAQGVFAFGGVAMGVFAFGGLALGLFAYGGLALGLLAVGGLGIALLAATGGLAIAPIALGGGAIGYFGNGGYAIATHRLDAVVRDPVAERFFLPWAAHWASNLQIVNAVALVAIIFIVSVVPWWLQRRLNHPRHPGVTRRGWALLFLCLLPLMLGAFLIAQLSLKSKHRAETQQVVRGQLQSALANEISTKLSAQKINFSQIHFAFDQDAPKVKVTFTGLQSWRNNTNGTPRALNGQLNLEFVSPQGCDVSGTGDLSFFRDYFEVANSLVWWTGGDLSPSQTPDYAKATATLRDISNKIEFLEVAFDQNDFETASNHVAWLQARFRTYNALIPETRYRIPSSVMDNVDACAEAFPAGNLGRAKSLFGVAMKSLDPNLPEQIEALARGQTPIETWAPTLTAGEKPDLSKIRSEIKKLIDDGDYGTALQRQLWYFYHAEDFGESDVIRLTFGISDWSELGERYPKAKQTLLDIRDKDLRRFFHGGGSSGLFSEVSALNGKLKDNDATYDLFKTLDHKNPKLAQGCYFYAEDLLVEKGDYALCRKYIGKPQQRFELNQRSWQSSVDSQKRLAEAYQRMDADNIKRGFTNAPAPFSASPSMKQSNDNRFIAKTRQLIEILVATESRAEAQTIRDLAVATLDVPELRSAVSDAEQTVRIKRGQQHDGTSSAAASPKAIPHQSTQPAELEFRLVAVEGDKLSGADELADPNDRSGQTKVRVLKEVLLDSSAVSNATLETNAPPGASKVISVTLKADAVRKFSKITAANIGRRLAIVWRGRILSAPVIQTAITGPAVSINGNISDAEAVVLVDLLNYNSGASKLEAVREELRQLRTKYTDAYPLIQQKQRELEELEKVATNQ